MCSANRAHAYATNTCTCTILSPRSYILVWWPYYESLLPMAMVGDHNTPPHDSSRPDAVESHHPCIVHGVMRPWLFHLAWIGRRLHPCYSHRLIRLVLKKISIELVGSSDLTRLFLNWQKTLIIQVNCLHVVVSNLVKEFRYCSPVLPAHVQ